MREIHVLCGNCELLSGRVSNPDPHPKVTKVKYVTTVQILCIGTDRSQQTVQTKIRLLLKKQSDQGLRCLPFHQHLLDAFMQLHQTFLFLGQLWQLFEVSQILEFLRYPIHYYCEYSN